MTVSDLIIAVGVTNSAPSLNPETAQTPAVKPSEKSLQRPISGTESPRQILRESRSDTSVCLGTDSTPPV
jgi:hypothetical protein